MATTYMPLSFDMSRNVVSTAFTRTMLDGQLERVGDVICAPTSVCRQMESSIGIKPVISTKLDSAP